MAVNKSGNSEIREIMYFNKPTRSNTDKLIDFIIGKIENLGIDHVMIAWSSGYTLRKFLKAVEGLDLKLKIVTVTNPKGGTIGGRKVSIDDETREALEGKSIKVCYLNDDLHLGEPAAPDAHQQFLRNMLLPWLPAHIDPLSLEVGVDLAPFLALSQGFRVCVGCLVLAVRHGLIPEGKKVLCLSGMATAAILDASPIVRKCHVNEILGLERNSDWDLLPKAGLKRMVAITI